MYYDVEIKFAVINIRVNATNKTEARNKALARLGRRNPVSLIKKNYGNHFKEIYITEL